MECNRETYRERERRKRQRKIATHIIDEERKGERCDDDRMNRRRE